MTQDVAFPQDRTCPYQPPPGYEPLREARPLTRVTLFDGRRVWAVTGHAVARQLLADPRLSSDRTHEDFPSPTARGATVRGQRLPLVGVDDPEHNAQRRKLIPSFSAKRIAELRPRIQRTVDELLDSLEEQGPPGDLVTAFAFPLPAKVICALLGAPYADAGFFEEQSRRLTLGTRPQDVEQGRSELNRYFQQLIDSEWEAPGDGLIGDLIREQRAAGSSDRQELVMLAGVLLVGGFETTANMISLGTYTLLRHPQRLAELRADRTLMPAAVEELLRFTSIADIMLRMATQDIEIAGHTLRAGDGIVFPLSLINRDADVYPEADRLDWHRAARHHVAFGFGVHQCLGQNLARAELEIALWTLFRRLPKLDFAVPPHEIAFKPGSTIQGLIELPLTW
ncbi:cytochrome P450 [Streptomyces sp. SID14478]|uniref:cytochrome P450 n=1 Tax=Streptomyces sp. SID14478 TaxID=2706073 RepID=UPI0013DB5C56|nr:cytochrome P450 [Streptomyces sp. SID14478]